MPVDGDIRRKEGELVKYKNYFSGWGKRYFRLERSYLHYFQTKHSHSPVATVTRGEISEVKPSTSCPGKDNVFEIVQKNGVIWYCQAKSAEEMVSWIQALSTVPFLLDAGKYQIVPMSEAPPANNNGNFQPTAPPAYHDTAVCIDSPYRELSYQAHQIAYSNNTSHDCVQHILPPPYAVDGNAPPAMVPPPHQHNQHPHQYPPQHFHPHF